MRLSREGEERCLADLGGQGDRKPTTLDRSPLRGVNLLPKNWTQIRRLLAYSSAVRTVRGVSDGQMVDTATAGT